MVIQPNGAVTDSGAGSAYALGSNIGRQVADQFNVVPQVQIQAGHDVTRNIRTSVGYDALYMNQVVRPGNQIDPWLGTVNGVDFPQPQFNKTDFWAHGVSFGLELRY